MDQVQLFQQSPRDGLACVCLWPSYDVVDYHDKRVRVPVSEPTFKTPINHPTNTPPPPPTYIGARTTTTQTTIYVGQQPNLNGICFLSIPFSKNISSLRGICLVFLSGISCRQFFLKFSIRIKITFKYVFQIERYKLPTSR